MTNEKRVTPKASFEYHDADILEENTNKELIEMAKEAFYLDGANTAAYVELLDDDNSEQ